MNILYFLNFFPTRHRNVAHDEILELIRSGHEIRVIAVWGGEKTQAARLPFEVFCLRHRVRILTLFRLFWRDSRRFVWHLKELRRLLGRREALRYFSQYDSLLVEGADRIHAHFASNAALRAYLVAQYYGIPFSCTGHGSELLLYPEPYLKELIVNARPFITISDYNKRLLLQKYKLEDSQIVVNYCGVDAAYFQKEKPGPPSVFTVTSVTALKKIKGVIFLIEALRQIDREKIDCRCNIIGSGNDHDELLTLIHQYGLSEKILLLGARSPSEIKDYLGESSVFVLPSLSEGLPIAVMEAMAMALPVVASNITGLPEIVEDGSSGFLVETENADALADKIAHFYHHPDAIDRMGRRGREIILQKFELKSNVGKLEKLLELHPGLTLKQIGD